MSERIQSLRSANLRLKKTIDRSRGDYYDLEMEMYKELRRLHKEYVYFRNKTHALEYDYGVLEGDCEALEREKFQIVEFCGKVLLEYNRVAELYLKLKTRFKEVAWEKQLITFYFQKNEAKIFSFGNVPKPSPEEHAAFTSGKSFGYSGDGEEVEIIDTQPFLLYLANVK
ncbi:hypothetical protein FWH09_01680 [Candidatus Saccharibacteria bacterium]|nr:hypothetical protein [Candidatus Saccharibacteria bacterium]